jgi:hypothetical protein
VAHRRFAVSAGLAYRPTMTRRMSFGAVVPLEIP